MKCLVCGNHLAPASLYCPACGATVSAAPPSTSAPAQGANSTAATPPASVHTAPPPQRARTAFLGRYGPGNPSLPPPSTLTLTPNQPEGTTRDAAPAPTALAHQSPSEAAPPALPESPLPSQAPTATHPESPTQGSTLLLPAPPPPPPPAPRATSTAPHSETAPTDTPARLHQLLERPLTARLIAGVAALLLIVILAELSSFGYRVYKKNEANQRATATTQAALHTTATSAAQATASATAILFNDPLTTNRNGWSEARGSAFFQNGQYHLHNTDPNKTLNSYYEGRIFGDSKVQVTVTFYSSSAPNVAAPYASGLVLRADPTAPGNKYAFFITPNGTYNFALHDDNGFYNNGWTDLTLTPFASSSAIHIGKGATNTLTVIARGNTFTLLINGQQIESVSDEYAPFPAGWIGVMVEGADMEAGFSNLLVYGPDA
jgi:hypothetical protein